MKTQIIDTVLWLEIVFISYVSISGYIRHLNLPNPGAFGAAHMWEILAYFTLIAILLLCDVNRKITYVIAAPLLLIIAILGLIGGWLFVVT